MATARLKKISILKHVNYLVWATRAVAAANRNWRARHPLRGDVLMTRNGLHSHLFHWAIAHQLIDDPGPRRPGPLSASVALAFDRHPELIKAEARTYWRSLVREQESWT